MRMKMKEQAIDRSSERSQAEELNCSGDAAVKRRGHLSDVRAGKAGKGLVRKKNSKKRRASESRSLLDTPLELRPGARVLIDLDLVGAS